MRHAELAPNITVKYALVLGMCGRNSLFTNQAFLEDRFDATATQLIPQHYNIAPDDDEAVITNDHPDEITPIEGWFIPPWEEE